MASLFVSRQIVNQTRLTFRTRTLPTFLHHWSLLRVKRFFDQKKVPERQNFLKIFIETAFLELKNS